MRGNLEIHQFKMGGGGGGGWGGGGGGLIIVSWSKNLIAFQLSQLFSAKETKINMPKK